MFFPSDFYHSFDLYLMYFLHLSCCSDNAKARGKERERDSENDRNIERNAMRWA